MSRIAFYTFGILREPFGNEQVQPFFDWVPSVFEAAENTDGFIDRPRIDEKDWGRPVSPHFYDVQKYPGAPADNPDARAPVTLSLWADLESVYAFAYRGAHGEALRKRKEWFVKPDWPTYAARWVGDDHVPTYEEAIERQKHIHHNGPTRYAFDLKTPFDELGNPTQLSRSRVAERRKGVG